MVKVLDACAELAALPTQRERPERYVADEQISAGYMHAVTYAKNRIQSADATQGTYVRDYPEDLLKILALESVRRKILIDNALATYRGLRLSVVGVGLFG